MFKMTLLGKFSNLKLEEMAKHMTVFLTRHCCHSARGSSFKYYPEVENIINVQINHEQKAAHDYLAIASHFGHPDVARRGCYNYFMRMYSEEVHHSQVLIRYQLTRGGRVMLQQLEYPNIKHDISMLEAFAVALDMEHFVTQKLEDVVVLAESLKDYQCADFITSDFLKEQVKSIHDVSTLLEILQRVATSEHALYHFDLDLETRFPYKKVEITLNNS